ncbi:MULTISPECIES: LexA family protein [Companilactobacillus]|uniref:XRE family transcriptional regulator n=1 Tax=Companilactobacillus ginsenosidimutans TaxID=1007676 RepID=A0A0H4R3G7_9LACO|nr:MULTISPECIES: XRE family transcriptional regulator [Companilactobacillus]AKP66112.1 XRE family transcriptional regulator [Companilactobacillus ginsenosidimutans]AKP68320.1 XRE family transcriptional regulator [Companilactobacillus ginsenosidimutans]
MRTNDEIMNILDDLKSKQNLSISEIARRTGMAKSAVSRYFNRTREFPLNRVNDFAKAFHIEPDYLLNIDNSQSPKHKTAMIPILGEIACGDPITAEENIEGYLEEPEDSLPSGTVFYLVAKGHSMEPTIPNGSNVLIREQPEVEDDEIAAVLVNSDTEATLKRVKHSGNIVMLMPDNKDYDPIIVTKDSPARILGKAIRYTTEL